MSGRFTPRDPAQIAQLIAAYPLAWVVSYGDGDFAATPLPLLAEAGAAGDIVALFGHFGRTNPQVAGLRRAPRALILFHGPDGYVSPGLVSKPAWAPTWNYAVLKFQVDIEFVEAETDAALVRLTAMVEASRAEPWTVDQMGERYARLRTGIVAFRAHVRSVEARFKLGQDETPATLAEILDGHSDPALVAWMRATNAD